MLSCYGALGSALSFIIHHGNKAIAKLPDEILVYRGLQLSKQELSDKYVVGTKTNLNGYTSSTLVKKKALGFAFQEI